MIKFCVNDQGRFVEISDFINIAKSFFLLESQSSNIDPQKGQQGSGVSEATLDDDISAGETVEIDLASGRLSFPDLGATVDCAPLPDFLLAMINDGGLVPHLEKKLRGGARDA